MEQKRNNGRAKALPRDRASIEAINSRKARRKNGGMMNKKAAALRVKVANAAEKAVEDCWHKLDGTPILDLEQYVYNYLAAQKEADKYTPIEIMIGTDGTAHGTETSTVRLMSVICFRKVGKGAHVIKRRETHIKPYELAMYLRSIGLDFAVHLDLNPNQSHESFNVYTTIKGFFEGLGFVTEYKPDSAAAMCAADWLL